MSKSRKNIDRTVIYLLGFLVVLTILASLFSWKWDLTEDNRFTLTPSTKEMLKNLDDIIYVKILLEGDFESNFKRLKNECEEMLGNFQRYTSQIIYETENPLSGNLETVHATQESLAKDFIFPFTVGSVAQSGRSEQQLYPYALFYFGERMVPVNLLEDQVPGVPPEVTLNNSIQLLEYKFASAIQKLEKPRKGNIIFSMGHGELLPESTRSLELSLRQLGFNTGRIDIRRHVKINPELDVLVVARPRAAFSDTTKFKIDQYIMQGGKVLWLIDALDVSLDSVQAYGEWIPPSYQTDLEDLFFRYGFRLQPNLTLDLNCSQIPLSTSIPGSSPVFNFFDYVYHPLVRPGVDHPIVQNIDPVNLIYAGTIDTIQTKTAVQKTVLLKSSENTLVQLSPMRLNLEVVRVPMDAARFNKGPQNLALLLEGAFPSLYENRISSRFEEMLRSAGDPFRSISAETKMIVVSDGDIIKNQIDSDRGPSPMGYNPYQRSVFKGNKDFILNAIEYMLDDRGVIAARGKEIKLRLLDKTKVQENQSFWQIFNIVVPIGILGIFGLLSAYFRRRKYMV